MNFPLEDMINVIYVLGECSKNCLLASRVYRERYPNRRHPNERAFLRLKERFDTSGNVSYQPHALPKRVFNEDNEFLVMTNLVENPNTSTRKLSTELDISRRTIGRIIKKNKFHPYKIQMHQELLERDFPIRINICEWFSGLINGYPDFLKKVLFSDEATFHRNGFVNRRNFHFYSDSNPHLFRTTTQTKWSINAWGGIVGDTVIGPYFFEGSLTGRRYYNFLKNHLGELLEEVDLNTRVNLWFQ